MNFKFLLPNTENFDESTILPFFVITTFGFLIFVCFLHFKQYDNITRFYKQTKIFDKLINSLMFSFLLSYCHILLAHYLLKQIHHD